MLGGNEEPFVDYPRDRIYVIVQCMCMELPKVVSHQS
jgi:hypothetical protein